jgi:hypothetical protein
VVDTLVESECRLSVFFDHERRRVSLLIRADAASSAAQLKLLATVLKQPTLWDDTGAVPKNVGYPSEGEGARGRGRGSGGGAGRRRGRDEDLEEGGELDGDGEHLVHETNPAARDATLAADLGADDDDDY